MKDFFHEYKYYMNLKKEGKFFKLSIMIFIISPFPAPSSMRLNFLGEPKLFQKLIIQIAIISEKSLEIFGAV